VRKPAFAAHLYQRTRLRVGIAPNGNINYVTAASKLISALRVRD
jgi:hypothetical protein